MALAGTSMLAERLEDKGRPGGDVDSVTDPQILDRNHGLEEQASYKRLAGTLMAMSGLDAASGCSGNASCWRSRALTL